MIFVVHKKAAVASVLSHPPPPRPLCIACFSFLMVCGLQKLACTLFFFFPFYDVCYT